MISPMNRPKSLSELSATTAPSNACIKDHATQKSTLIWPLPKGTPSSLQDGTTLHPVNANLYLQTGPSSATPPLKHCRLAKPLLQKETQLLPRRKARVSNQKTSISCALLISSMGHLHLFVSQKIIAH